jgi:multiple sugar transport system substrate-binding protein
MTTKKFSRREFLKFGGIAAGGAVLAACAPATTATPLATQAPATEAPTGAATEAPTQAPAAKKVEGHVVAAVHSGEFTEDYIKTFQAAHPDITVEQVEPDPQKFFAMVAAGTPPDLLRTQGPIVPSLLARKLLYDLTSYFNSSTMIKVDDLAGANKLYWAKSPLEIGEGNIYGMVKDWSPDFTVFVNDKLFNDAGVTPPADDKPLTWDEVHELAKQTAKMEGARVATWGYGFDSAWIDRIWMNALAEKGESLYKNSFSAVDFSDDAKAIAKYFFDLTQENLSVGPTNPSPNGWAGGDFNANPGILSMMQYGYWFSGEIKQDNPDLPSSARMLPAATWSGEHRDPCMTATGYIMVSKTQVADAAWVVFEDYMAGQAAVDRAKSGWGVPAQKSMWNLMPTETDFDKQVQKVLAGELDVSDKALQFNPFLGEGQFANSWNTHLNEALTDTSVGFDGLMSALEKDVNEFISEGISRLS